MTRSKIDTNRDNIEVWPRHNVQVASAINSNNNNYNYLCKKYISLIFIFLYLVQ